MPDTRASDGDPLGSGVGSQDPPRAGSFEGDRDPDRSVRSQGGLVVAGLLILAVLVWFAASAGAGRGIQVEVVDTDGQPVVGVAVEAVRSKGAPDDLGGASTVSAVTDAQGRATLGGIGPGDMTIHVARRPEWPDIPELPNLPPDLLGRPTNTAFDYVLALFQTPSGRWYRRPAPLQEGGRVVVERVPLIELRGHLEGEVGHPLPVAFHLLADPHGPPSDTHLHPRHGFDPRPGAEVVEVPRPPPGVSLRGRVVCLPRETQVGSAVITLDAASVAQDLVMTDAWLLSEPSQEAPVGPPLLVRLRDERGPVPVSREEVLRESGRAICVAHVTGNRGGGGSALGLPLVDGGIRFAAASVDSRYAVWIHVAGRGWAHLRASTAGKLPVDVTLRRNRATVRNVEVSTIGELRLWATLVGHEDVRVEGRLMAGKGASKAEILFEDLPPGRWKVELATVRQEGPRTGAGSAVRVATLNVEDDGTVEDVEAE
jgi:hypothetical protein